MDKRGEVYFKSHTLHHHNVLCCHNTCLSLCLISFPPPPRGPTQYFTDEGEGVSDFFGFEILAKRDFLGSWKDVGIFLKAKKTQEFFWVL